jgi:SAM-dependent methyltransferase
MKQSFYGNLRAQGYDIGTDQSEIIGFYLAQWNRLGRPTPLLEPMSGTGLNLIPFLQAGAECDGLDASPYMIEICRGKLDNLGLKCGLYEQYIEKMALPRRYGFIFIPGGSYGHIYDKQIAGGCLRRIYEHLSPGGWLVLDVRPPAMMRKFGKPGEVDHLLDEYPDGSTIFATGYWEHLEEGRVIRKWNKMERFVNDQLTETEIFDYRERLYERAELEVELKAAGFATIQITKAYQPDVAPDENDGIVFTCRK